MQHHRTRRTPSGPGFCQKALLTILRMHDVVLAEPNGPMIAVRNRWSLTNPSAFGPTGAIRDAKPLT